MEGMEGTKSLFTPMATNVQMNHDLEGKLVDPKYYRSVIGSLLYFTASRSNILFVGGMCTSCAKKLYLIVFKRILSNIKGALKVGL